MRAEDRSWGVKLLMVIVLAAVAWLGGGAVRAGLLFLGNDADFASDVGAMSAVALFLLLVLGYWLYDYVPWSQGEPRSGRTR
ncbi:hypothetical protein [Haloglomus salinum]|jgi:hypothetical protein|uniref:hypothetical protein n=1 Tax=Haloglomus salinum TaxID=2962673 RepID=UPI0020C9DC44|nr:hypothetical protein [Haloglomus salinum]